MEEIKVFAVASAAVVAASTYCFFLASRIPPGGGRLLSIGPVLYLFYLLPWQFSSIHLRGISAFFLTWLGIFKLLLFSFDLGPLSAHKTSLPNFICIASLPVKSKHDNPFQKTPKDPRNLPLRLPIEALLLGLLIRLYDFRQRFHPKVLLSVYCLHIFLGLELVLAAGAAVARTGTGLELEPQFDEPYLSTSLQDFWGRRWNLMVTRILRPTVYLQVRRRAGRVAGILAVFSVSGLMHELIFYYFTEADPSWEVTAFFVLHGACVAAEVAAKKAAGGRFRVPVGVARAATLGFVAVSGFWLFFPPLVRNGVDRRVVEESRFCLNTLVGNWRSWPERRRA